MPPTTLTSDVSGERPSFAAWTNGDTRYITITSDPPNVQSLKTEVGSPDRLQVDRKVVNRKLQMLCFILHTVQHFTQKRDEGQKAQKKN